MSFPEIQSCIVCEAIRQEEGGKLSILGFRGVLPNLELAVSDKPKAFVLLLIVGPTQGGAFRLSTTLEDPAGNVVGSPQNTTLTLAPIPRERGGFLAANFGEVIINKEGTYTVRVTANEEAVLKQSSTPFDRPIRISNSNLWFDFHRSFPLQLAPADHGAAHSGRD